MPVSTEQHNRLFDNILCVSAHLLAGGGRGGGGVLVQLILVHHEARGPGHVLPRVHVIVPPDYNDQH